MSLTFARIGIIARNNDDRVQQTLTPLVAHLLEHGAQVYLDDTLRTASPAVNYCARSELGACCDLVVVIGGDGTLLDASRTVADHQTPLLGVNLGRLGFLVDVSPAHMHAALDDVLNGHFIKEPRLRLRARLIRADGGEDGEPVCALNECVVRNQEFARVLDFDTYMHGNFISHHRADGIIVATPTGSTAYALSGGGPVVHPDMPALSLVPICPHTLSDRPLIVDANSDIEIRISDSHEGTALFTTDGHVTRTMAPGDRIVIERAQQDLILVHPPDYDYFHILRNKLEWGRGRDAPHPV